VDWQFADVAPIHSPGTSDLVLRNVNTGAFEVYDIAGDSLIKAGSLGAVGLNWQLGGIVLGPPEAQWAPRTIPPLSSCKPWRGLAAAAARPTDLTPASSMPIHHTDVSDPPRHA
jgi:hypothetical protein